MTLRRDHGSPKVRRCQCCSMDGCFRPAVILLRNLHGRDVTVCRPHWLGLDCYRSSIVEIVGSLPTPRCARTMCARWAVEVLHAADGVPEPVCDQHRDEDAWVTMNQYGGAPRGSGRASR